MANDLEQLVLSVSADTRQITRALKKLEGDIGGSTKKIESSFDKAGARIGASFVRSLKGIGIAAIGGIAGAAVIGAIKQASDAYTNLGNRLRALGVEGEKTAETQNEVVQIALRSGASLESVGDLYTRLLATTKDLGVSQEEVGRATEIISKGFAISGAAASEAASASLQLSQAFASGVLRGEEFNAIMENSQPLAQAIAKEFGVTTGQLRAMAEAGELVAGRVFKAIINSGPEIEKAYATSIPTVERALGNLGTAFSALVGKMDQSVGISQRVAGAFTAMANTINNLSIADPLKDATESLRLLQAQQKSSITGAGRLGGAPTGLLGGSSPAGRLGSGTSIQARIDAQAATVEKLVVERIDAVAQAAIKAYGGGDQPTVDFGEGISVPGTPVPKPRPVDLGKKGTKDTVATYKEIKAAADERIAQLKVEETTLGMTTAAAEAYRFEQQFLAQALQDNIQLTPQELKDLHDKAEAYGALSAQIEATKDKQQELEQSIQQAQGLAQDFFGGVGQSILSGASAVDALKDAFGRLEQQLLDMALNAIIQKLFTTLLGAGGGPTNIIGGAGPMAVPTFGKAGGGPVLKGRPYKVGEQGPEMFVPDVSGRIIPHHALAAAGGGAAGPTVTNNFLLQPGIEAKEQGSQQDADGNETRNYVIATTQQGMAKGQFRLWGAGSGPKRRGSA